MYINNIGAAGSHGSGSNFILASIPQPVWAAAFGLAQTPCVAGLAVSSFRNFQPA